MPGAVAMHVGKVETMETLRAMVCVCGGGGWASGRGGGGCRHSEGGRGLSKVGAGSGGAVPQNRGSYRG